MGTILFSLYLHQRTVYLPLRTDTISRDALLNAKYSNVLAIRSQQTLLSDPKEINAKFRSFSAALYTSEISLDKDKCKNFLSNLNLPSLTLDEANDLTGPITLADLYKALMGMKKGKSPGWDGIPPECYVTLCSFISCCRKTF